MATTMTMTMLSGLLSTDHSGRRAETPQVREHWQQQRHTADLMNQTQHRLRALAADEELQAPGDRQHAYQR